MNYQRNNLQKSGSPYLEQHGQQPIWWQTWDRDVLRYARKADKPLFVSVGYASCHWCHVMAREAFSDPDVADYLNQHFVSIKVDREQRPDIDRYLMSFLQALKGQGGWPLNVFLSPDLRPIYALTYTPLEPRYGMPGFLTPLKKIKAFYNQNRDQLQPYQLPKESSPDYHEKEIIDTLFQY